PSTIPLLPGSSIYYTMFWAINGDKESMNKYASSTLLSGLGIALGAVIASAIVKFIYLFIKKQKNNY
ncbi:MAG: threonine/serine exporter family protein, partial [Eubacterium sp.]|nr:threonine/serine exporter family protein [Eubacterium sp.]